MTARNKRTQQYGGTSTRKRVEAEKKKQLSAQHCQAVDETRLGVEETVWDDERDVVEVRASAC